MRTAQDEVNQEDSEQNEVEKERFRVTVLSYACNTFHVSNQSATSQSSNTFHQRKCFW